MSVGEQWGHGNLEKSIFDAILQRRNKYGRNIKGTGRGWKTASKKLTS
jgi:hypothetical protein